MRVWLAAIAAAFVAAPGAAGEPGVVALLANREVLRVDATGRVLARTMVGARDPHADAVGSYLGLSRDGARLFVLSPPGGGAEGGQALAVLDPVSLQRIVAVALPRGLVFRSLVVGPRTGRLYVSGNAAGGASICAAPPVESPRWRCAAVRPRGARLDWRVLDSAVSPDERRLLVSYHGPNTTGADWVATATLARCHTAPAVCLPSHGRAVFRTNGRVLATTGEGPLLELSTAGTRTREWDLRLPGNHLMAFALSPDGGRVAAVGPCGYAGGLSVVDLAARTVAVRGYPDTLCADRVAFLGARTVALARNRMPVPQGSPARLDFVDLATGRIVARRPTSSEVVDVLAAAR